MKKKLLAVAVVGALASPSAFAQTLYGIIDLGYQNNKFSDGDVNKDFLSQGQHSGSRFGVRGSEDLAGGTYAMYQIEFDITADNGSTPANGMTNRLTFVGLGSKAWGELTLGRQYTHTFHTFAVGSAAAYGTFGSVFSWTGFIPTRASNSFKYSSPVIGGFSVGAIWGLSGGGLNNDTEPTAVRGEANYWDAAVRWTPGPIGVAASYGVNTIEAGAVAPVFTLNPATGAIAASAAVPAGEVETTRTQLSANWDNRAFGIYGNWWNQETETRGPTTEDRTGWAISGVARFGGRHELYAVYGSQENDIGGGATESTVWGISYQHVMSKRTRVYVGFQDVDNEAASTRQVNLAHAGTTVAAGYDPRAFQIGLLHSF
ncbi:MAG: porin [Betaproteobacteria bacterium]